MMFGVTSRHSNILIYFTSGETVLSPDDSREFNLVLVQTLGVVKEFEYGSSKTCTLEYMRPLEV
jgi:hypothetical protein